MCNADKGKTTLTSRTQNQHHLNDPVRECQNLSSSAMNQLGFTDRKVQRLKYKPENSLSLFIATATPIIPVGDFSNFFGRLVFLERKEKNSPLFPSIAFLLQD